MPPSAMVTPSSIVAQIADNNSAKTNTPGRPACQHHTAGSRRSSSSIPVIAAALSRACAWAQRFELTGQPPHCQCCGIWRSLSMTPWLIAVQRRRRGISSPEPESANNNSAKKKWRRRPPHHRAPTSRCSAQAARAGRSASELAGSLESARASRARVTTANRVPPELVGSLESARASRARIPSEG